MNFITCDHAYALFPIDTFVKRRTLVTVDDDPQYALQKYTRRGFSVSRNVQDAEDHVGLYRSTGDKWTWTLQLDMEGIHKILPLTTTSDALPWDPSVPNMWTMINNRGLRFKHELKSYPVTRYEYLVAQEEHSSMMDDLFDELSWFEGALAEERQDLGLPAIMTWCVIQLIQTLP